MRNPKRINRILRKIEFIRQEYPDLRLSQLLYNTWQFEFHTEDDKFEENLEEFIKNNTKKIYQPNAFTT